MSSILKRTLLGATLLAAVSVPAMAEPIRSSAAGTVTKVGTINLLALASGTSGGPAPQAAAHASRGLEYRTTPVMRPNVVTARAAPADLPHESLVRVVPEGRGGFTRVKGFDGLDHNDQRTLADAGNQFSLEPPDQALAVGNGFVVEAVNDAMTVFDTTGHALLPVPVSMNRFFNQVSEYNRTTFQQGPFLSDPRAYYDAATQRFFIVEWATLNFADGTPLGISVQFMAVSQTSDPTGNWLLYSFETTNAKLADCPCFPDYQQLGMDANGVFISQNTFGIFSGAYAGAQIYALSKAALEDGTGGPLLQFPIQAGDFTVHPTVVPAGGGYATEDGGTEYLIEHLADESATGYSTFLRLFAIGNTSSLNTASPSLTLGRTTLAGQVVANAPDGGLPPAVQPGGERPLAKTLSSPKPPKPLLNADDARVSATPLYVNGALWAAVGSAYVRTNGKVSNEIAWFDIAVSGGASAPAASITAQGMVTAPDGASLLYPAIAMNTAGQGGVGVTMSGPKTYPGAAIFMLTAAGAGKVKVIGSSTTPDDGFTAYAAYGGNGVGRWGDYGAAAVDEAGDLWFGNEYIPTVTTARPRSVLANWGTYITHVTP